MCRRLWEQGILLTLWIFTRGTSRCAELCEYWIDILTWEKQPSCALANDGTSFGARTVHLNSCGQLKFLSFNFCYHNLIYFKLGITVGNVIMRTGSLFTIAKMAFLLNVTTVTERWHRDHVNRVWRRRTGVKTEQEPMFLRFQGVSPGDLNSACFIQSLSTHATRWAKTRHQRTD